MTTRSSLPKNDRHANIFHYGFVSSQASGALQSLMSTGGLSPEGKNSLEQAVGLIKDIITAQKLYGPEKESVAPSDSALGAFTCALEVIVAHQPEFEIHDIPELIGLFALLVTTLDDVVQGEPIPAGDNLAKTRLFFKRFSELMLAQLSVPQEFDVPEGSSELLRLIKELVHRARLIKSVLTKFRELPFPSDAPMVLADIIFSIADAMEKWALRQRQTGADAGDLVQQLRLAVQAMEMVLGEHLRFVQRATTRQTPWSLVQPVEKLGRKLHSDSCFVIRPQWSSSYAIREVIALYKRTFGQLLGQSMSDIIERHNIQRLFVVSFPYVQRLNVLQHVIISHELGHPIAEEFIDQEDRGYLAALSSEVSKVVADAYPTLTAIQGLLKVNDLLNVVTIVRRRALTEVISDLVKANLFGPAAMWALETHALPFYLDTVESREPEAHYPPWRYRLRLLCNELPETWIDEFLRRGEFEERVCTEVRRRIAELRVVVAGDGDRKLLQDYPVTRIAYNSVEATLANARTFVRQRLGDCGFGLDTLLGAANTKLLDRVSNWVPPDAYIDDGTEKIANIFSILNVGWIRYIVDYSTISEDEAPYFNQLSALNRLILKAVEFVDIRMAWKQRVVS